MMEVPIVALLTDYGISDSYVSQVKAVILGYRRDVQLVDITHEIESFNEFEAAFILSTASNRFPAGTVFVCVVDPAVGSDRKSIVIETVTGKWFIGPDTGILYPAALKEKIIMVSRIITERLKWDISGTFHGRDVFAHVAGMLIAGRDLNPILTPVDDYRKIIIPRPVFREREIETMVLHVDKFGNVITSMGKSDIPPGVDRFDVRSASISLYDVPLRTHYSAVEPGCPLLVLGGTDHLEVAVNRGSAAQLLNVRAGEVLILNY